MKLIDLIKNKYLPIFRNDQFRISLTIIGISIAGLIFLSGSMIIDSVRYNQYQVIDELPNDIIVHQNIPDNLYNYLRKIESNQRLIPFETTELVKYEEINHDTYRIKLNVMGTHSNFISSCVPYKSYFPTSGIKYLQGRVWTAQEAEQKLNVVVITYFTSKIFFGDANPLGQKLSIPSFGEFIVIGVINNLKEYEDSYDSIYNKNRIIDTPLAHLFIPLNTYKHYKFNFNEGFTSVLLQQNDKAEPIRIALKKSAYGDVFSNSYTQASTLESFEKDLDVYKAIFRIVYIVVFIFSFIIIVNTLLFSIKSRINEIGIRVALGASKRDILFQFIFEAIILAFIALSLSLVVIYLIIQVLNIGLIQDFSFTISLKSIANYIFGFLLTVLLASSLPAYYASRINVIDTLRLE